MMNGLDLQGKEIKFLMYADDQVIMSPTEHGIQQNLSPLETLCQNWGLDINLEKTKIMVFQKKERLVAEIQTYFHCERGHPSTYNGLQLLRYNH